MYKFKRLIRAAIFHIRNLVMRSHNLRRDKNLLSHATFDWLICRTFPRLYADRHVNMRSTCMCWGFEIGTGWQQLVWDLSAKLETEILKLPKGERWNYRASQVKSKFAGLRFYMTGSTDEIDKLISDAEDESVRTCEMCGKPGDVYGGGWVTCYCPKCAAERGMHVKTAEVE